MIYKDCQSVWHFVKKNVIFTLCDNQLGNDSNNQQPKQWFKQNREQRITYLEGERFLREWKQGRIGNEEEETNKKNQGRSNKELAPTKEEEQQQQGRKKYKHELCKVRWH